MDPLGLIAGGGQLPLNVAFGCSKAGRPVFVARLQGFAAEALAGFDGLDLALGELGKAIAAFQSAGCETICLAGSVARPDFRDFRADARGMAALPRAIEAARGGDDGLLSFLLAEFESEGFRVVGAHEVMSELTLAAETPSCRGPLAGDEADIVRAMTVARAIGALDIGQGAVCCAGLILAVEAQEGTDSMLRRVAELPSEVRGTPLARRGVLAKVRKPMQDMRVDLPAVGPDTVRAAAAAGLAGIAGEAGAVLLIDRSETVRLADALNLFVTGRALEPADVP